RHRVGGGLPVSLGRSLPVVASTDAGSVERCVVRRGASLSVVAAYPANTGGRRRAQGRAASSSYASCSKVLSPPRQAANWLPIGSPFAVQYNGTDIAVVPQALC